ncbi:MAG: tRNA pseudouridine(55) synthase TruB [Ardenticatenaceae bacterium]|nr:tRNA pseudouridine(55) synthase TruB [Ardenticatenaceae bacterium]
MIVDKPAGLTSHDVVARVRHLAGTRKVGHAGTLDPPATGVLVLALGKATRLLEYLSGHDKQYLATITLGSVTTTYDAEGEIVTTLVGPLPNRATVERALASFRGQIAQVPPIYSAIKQGGEALYAKARRGETVSAPPLREVTIYELDLLRYEPPTLDIRVRCSKGTYVRSLAHDLGRALGTGAFLAALRREASGPFTLAQAYPLPVLAQAAADGRLGDLLLPPGAGLEAYPAVPVTREELAVLHHGQAIDGPRAAPGTIGRALLEGALVAIIVYDGSAARWRPRKVLA